MACPACGGTSVYTPIALALTGPIAVGKSTIINALRSTGDLVILDSATLDVTGVLPPLQASAPAYVIVSDEGADMPEFGDALSKYLTAKCDATHPSIAHAAVVTFQMFCIAQQRARYALGLKQVTSLASRGFASILVLERSPMDSVLVFGPANGLSEYEIGILRLNAQTSWSPAAVYILSASEEDIIERARRRGRATEAAMLSDADAIYEKKIIARYDPSVWREVEPFSIVRMIPTGNGKEGIIRATTEFAEALRNWTRLAADRFITAH